MSDHASDSTSLLRAKAQETAQLLFVWAMAVMTGLAAAAAALAMWRLVGLSQDWLYQRDQGRLVDAVAALPVIWVIAIPVSGGLAVGVITKYVIGANRVHGVAEVIEATALGDGHIGTRQGLGAMLASVITLSSGGSTGREGPVVHFAAMLATLVNKRFGLRGLSARNLLGCAVAAAVSASFNAPIAGIIFAHEVILRHYALHALAPIALASVSGAVLSRLLHGDGPEFVLPDLVLGFYEELPAFFLLGVVCGLVAALVMHTAIQAVSWADRWQIRLRISPIIRPGLAGLVLGCLALAVPEIVGVGYSTTSDALSGQIMIGAAFVVVVVKAVALVVTLAGRMGGGVFSPALMIGALTGVVFGTVATNVFPANSGDETLYALAGMGAVAAAILGAPLSTALIVFEMTGDWQAGIAVLVAVGPAAALSAKLAGRSVFHMQLAARGVNLSEGPQQWALLMAKADDILRPLDDETNASWPAQDNPMTPEANLAQLMDYFQKTGATFVIIYDDDSQPIGMVTHQEALRAYAEILSRINAEQHG